jgi:hypothetical protein
MYRVYKRQNADKQRQKRRREKIEADLSRKRHGAVTNSDSQSPLKSIKSLNKNTTKKRKEEDPRSKHPAIITVHEIMTIYPKKALWDRIIREIGEEPDKEFLRESFELWVSVNGNPMNLQKWLLGPNATGKLPEVYGEKSNGTGKQFTKRTDADVKRESEAFIQKKFGLA